MTARTWNLYFSRIISTLILCGGHLQISATVEGEIGLDVEGNGFHRILTYNVTFKNLLNNDCLAAIYQELPSTVYVNVDEIAELRRQGMSTVCTTGETNVELFAEKAGQQNVTVCGSVISLSSCTLKIPIHQRYQYAQESGSHVNVTLPMPKLLVACRERIKDCRISKINLCEPCVSLATKWREVPYIILNGSNYEWSIPIGNSSQLTLVTYVTLLLTGICAVFIASAIYINVSKNHQKQD